MQKSDCNFAIGSTIAHHVSAEVLLDRAIPAILRLDRRRTREEDDDGGYDSTVFGPHGLIPFSCSGPCAEARCIVCRLLET